MKLLFWEIFLINLFTIFLYEFPTIDYIKDNTYSKIIIIHSFDDEIIPYKHSVFLSEYADKLISITGLHNKPIFNDNFFTTLKQIITDEY